MKEVAAITGGTSGLGKACVERFVKDGYEVRENFLSVISLDLLGGVLWKK